MRRNIKVGLSLLILIVITIGIGYFIYTLMTNEHFRAVAEVKLSSLLQRKTLEPPLFELVLDIPKSHFKVEEEISIKLYLINKSNYPITILHDVPFPLFVIWDENDRPLYGGLQYLLENFPVLRPGKPYYGWDGRWPQLGKDYLGVYTLVNSDLKIANMNDGYRLIASKPGVYTLKASAEFQILDMKRYIHPMSLVYDRNKMRILEKKEIFLQPFMVYIEDQ